MMDNKIAAFYNALSETPDGIIIKNFLDTWQNESKAKLITAIMEAAKKAEGK